MPQLGPLFLQYTASQMRKDHTTSRLPRKQAAGDFTVIFRLNKLQQPCGRSRDGARHDAMRQADRDGVVVAKRWKVAR
ncbi:hypothetical protein BV898_08751 [Hypsibius exemplaris]|uniref:Uncharacterized protein n=1 Tax=Hypsibius exemplaris TaxID=2072580 RepID=A0A1W0WPV2_HYPEX|nr:hypothetical protein BV898_08751 [Hypsibius exemplaris]